LTIAIIAGVVAIVVTDLITKSIEKAIILSKPGSDEEKQFRELIEGRSRATAKGGMDGVKDSLTPGKSFFWPW
jgi:hypothetical protein